MADGGAARYTNAEWSSFIDEVERDVHVDPKKVYACPDLGGLEFTKTIDHTLLKLDARAHQIDALCAEARVDGFASVCVRANFVHQSVANLKGSTVKVACVIGFHEGTYDLAEKLQETKLALQSGAHELDIVLNYPHLHSQSYTTIYHELAALRQTAPHPTLLKLILETSQLTPSQIIAGCAMAAAANFDFVKTSTGFNGEGATVGNVRLMKACCERLAGGRGRMMGVKAAGGIRTLEDAVGMLEAGATRLGTSGGVWIAKEAKARMEGRLGGTGNGNGERPGMQTRLFTDY